VRIRASPAWLAQQAPVCREGALLVAKALKPSQGDILAQNTMGGGRVRRVSAKSLRASASQLEGPAAAGVLPPGLRRGSLSAAGSVESPLASGRRLSGMSMLDGYATTSISASHISGSGGGGGALGQDPACGSWPEQEPQRPPDDTAGSAAAEQQGRLSRCGIPAPARGDAIQQASTAAQQPCSMERQLEERVRVELRITAGDDEDGSGGQQQQDCAAERAPAACSARLVRLRLHTGAAHSSAPEAAPAAHHPAGATPAAATAEQGRDDDAAPRQQLAAAASSRACGGRQLDAELDAGSSSPAAHTRGFAKSRAEPRAAAARGEGRSGAPAAAKAPSAGPSRAGSLQQHADGLPSPAARTHRSEQQDKGPAAAAAQQAITRRTVAEGIKEIRSVYGVGAQRPPKLKGRPGGS
jgi:hypothetical protein